MRNIFVLIFLTAIGTSAMGATPKYSGTLPVMFINTEKNTPVTSKEDYLQATYWVDNLGLEGYVSVASQTQPDTLQIKGRGNWTWTGFEKKPYRLKLNTKTSLLGLKKNKHFGLLAHADDQYSWLKNTMGFLLSEQIGLRWTPKQQPVEVVLNGDYIGLYMLTELPRVEKDRVNVTEQSDLATDNVSGGWLVEIDNYREANCIEFYEPQNQWHLDQCVWITPKTPEMLSSQQRQYLTSQMNQLNEAIYGTDAAMDAMMDIDEAAKFYLVQELMSDCESYHGSCYMYKQIGDDEKWSFGPVWDFGNSFKDREQYIYDHPEFSQVWIGQIASHMNFHEAVVRYWKHWKYYDYQSISGAADAFMNTIRQAAAADAKRWPQYNHSDVNRGKSDFMKKFNRHTTWLTTEWGEGEEDSELRDVEVVRSDAVARKRMVNGQLIITREALCFDLLGRQL